jgi:BMFP domain-containing protein YqiC
MSESTENEMWATVELMGHAQTAGRVGRPSEWGGLLRVDVPEGDGYRTEFYGMTAIYSIRFVSEEIARAFVRPARQIVAYDTPIVTREEHQYALNKAREQLYALESRNRELERRLTAVNALPGPVDEIEDELDGNGWNGDGF